MNSTYYNITVCPWCQKDCESSTKKKDYFTCYTPTDHCFHSYPGGYTLSIYHYYEKDYPYGHIRSGFQYIKEEKNGLSFYYTDMSNNKFIRSNDLNVTYSQAYQLFSNKNKLYKYLLLL